jgi:hypothetical protein
LILAILSVSSNPGINTAALLATVTAQTGTDALKQGQCV